METRPRRKGRRAILDPDLIAKRFPEQSRCAFCAWALVERTEIMRRFRCRECGRWSETAISCRSEIVWRKGVRPDLLPKQATIYEAIAEEQ